MLYKPTALGACSQCCVPQLSALNVHVAICTVVRRLHRHMNKSAKGQRVRQRQVQGNAVWRSLCTAQGKNPRGILPTVGWVLWEPHGVPRTDQYTTTATHMEHPSDQP